MHQIYLQETRVLNFFAVLPTNHGQKNCLRNESCQSDNRGEAAVSQEIQGIEVCREIVLHILTVNVVKICVLQKFMSVPWGRRRRMKQDRVKMSGDQ